MFPSRRATMGGDVFRDDFSLAFDGTDDFVLTDFKPDYIHTNATFAMWIKMNDLSGQQVMGSHGSKRWYFGFSSAKAFIGVANANKDDIVISPTPVAGQWLHYACTAIDGTATVYINGVAQSTTMSYSQNASTNPVDGFTIAARNNSGTMQTEMNANISEVVQYDKGLSASEIKTLYNGREPYNHKEGVCSSNLQAWWRMGDGDNDGFLDVVGVTPDIGLVQDMATPITKTEGVTGWTNVDFDTLSTSGTDISSAISDGSASHEVRSNAINATAGDLYEVSFVIAGSLIPSSNLTFKFGVDVNLNSSSFDYTIDNSGLHRMYARFTTTDSESYIGFRASSEACNFSVSNFSCKKIEGGSNGAALNMDGSNFTGDNP